MLQLWFLVVDEINTEESSHVLKTVRTDALYCLVGSVYSFSSMGVAKQHHFVVIVRTPVLTRSDWERKNTQNITTIMEVDSNAFFRTLKLVQAGPGENVQSTF